MLKYSHVVIIVLAATLFIYSCKKENTNLSKNLIAYICTADHNYGEVYLCKGDGSGARRISELGSKTLSDAEYSPEFSPDGKKIKFRGFDFMLKLYDLGSNSLVNIEKAFTSAWSSDSKKIAYIKTSDLERQIYLANADGSNAQKITSYEYFSNDTSIVFNGLAWHETENVIIACAGVNHTVMSGFHLIKIHPESGKVVTMYPLNLNDFFTLRGNKITWADGDTVFIHDLISKNTTHFVALGESPKNPVLSPDGNRVAYTKLGSYVYNGLSYQSTEIVTCNASGFDKRTVTKNSDIEDSYKYKSSFYPFWVSNSELLYSAGNIYKIKDDANPTASIIGKALKAGGQLQANN